MSWSVYHQESERAAEEAHAALRRGNVAQAKLLFIEAARAESNALESVASDKPRTIGITAISTASLWYKAGELLTSEQTAYKALAIPNIPAFAILELRELLQVIWNESAQSEAGVKFIPGQVIVSVKGGEVVTGGAPLELILSKVQTVQSIFYRTAEFMKNMPLRKKGPPSHEIQQQFRPWLFQSVPGSYQFAVAIQKPTQPELFPTDDPEPEAVTEVFLSILRAIGDAPDQELKDVVPDAGYRETFLKMTRNLAPTGKSFSQMEIRGAGDRKPIMLSPESRKVISEILRPTKTSVAKDGLEITLSGVLRALDLDKDWLEITVDGKHRRVKGVGETVDDIIGPMVNHRVTIRARPKGKGLEFIDIEQDE
jgi:hypothetical protein